MTQGKRYLVLGIAILVMGAVRMPFEKQLTAELQRESLLPPKLAIGTGEKIGQTFSAVSLGGLRTLVATFLNLRADTFFRAQKWADVAKTFNLIVDLAPRTRYYWDTGSWHLAYNAASYYFYDSKLPPLRRKLEWRNYILAGRNFLERGIRNNPKDPVLYERLGYLLADSNKVNVFGDPANVYELSYEAYHKAVELGASRSFTKRASLYSLARVPGREKDALNLAIEIKTELKALPPTMLALLYILKFHEDPDQPVIELVDSVFSSHQQAYKILENIWQRSRDRFPVDGVAKAITLLELELGISQERSVLNRDVEAPINMGDYFR